MALEEATKLRLLFYVATPLTDEICSNFPRTKVLLNNECRLVPLRGREKAETEIGRDG
jgi:hypothetical protein